jgi:hypothetical protein
VAVAVVPPHLELPLAAAATVSRQSAFIFEE